jgi:gamma-glutamylcyclotransferase (GGCT)/AIG2-like uncharacterized protein YtfP
LIITISKAADRMFATPFSGPHILFDMEDKERHLAVFVYGTLKRGHANHRQLCGGYVDAQPAQVWGRLYQLARQGYPKLVVPEQSIIWRATGTVVTDLQQFATLKEELAGAESTNQPAGWSLIDGELLTFDDPVRRLAAFDALETFQPDGSGEYVRVVVRCASPAAQLVWTYVAPPGWSAGENPPLGSVWNG